jgi:hypothetical protein
MFLREEVDDKLDEVSKPSAGLRKSLNFNAVKL